jgi:hypothetical protein
MLKKQCKSQPENPVIKHPIRLEPGVIPTGEEPGEGSYMPSQHDAEDENRHGWRRG